MQHARIPARIFRVSVVLGALALPVASVADQLQMRTAQRARPSRVRKDAMRIPQTEQPQMFDAMVSRVRVDVIVTDGDGNFVVDLGPDDFNLFEDGKEQKILNVQRVDLAAGQVHSLLDESQPVGVTSGKTVARHSPTTLPSAQDVGNTTDEAPPSTVSELGSIIFLID